MKRNFSLAIYIEFLRVKQLLSTEKNLFHFPKIKPIRNPRLQKEIKAYKTLHIIPENKTPTVKSQMAKKLSHLYTK